MEFDPITPTNQLEKGMEVKDRSPTERGGKSTKKGVNEDQVSVENVGRVKQIASNFSFLQEFVRSYRLKAKRS